MKNLILFLLLTSTQNTFAKSIVFPAGSMKQGNLIAKIETNCSGELAKTTECQSWAAILKVEAQTLLLILQDSYHPTVLAIFEDAVNLSDSGIKSIALNYLARMKNREDGGLISSALNAMFNEDSFLGNIAARILKNSNSALHDEVGSQFQSGHDPSLFDSVQNYSEIFTQELILSSTTDSFEALFVPGQERFMFLDQYYINKNQPTLTMGGPGFLVSSTLSELITHFKNVTHQSPALSLKAIEERYVQISAELQVILEAIQRGDYSQMAKMQVLQEEMAALNKQQTQWYEIGGYSEAFKKCTAFFIPDEQDKSKVGSVVLLREWPIFQKVSVQYLDKQK